ncbi:MAG: hypothetical protein M5T61_13545 [Acidimicrobiia bacterium]|nr:hypothetical protein [Acidimicrobiia bacterium]
MNAPLAPLGCAAAPGRHERSGTFEAPPFAGGTQHRRPGSRQRREAQGRESAPRAFDLVAEQAGAQVEDPAEPLVGRQGTWHPVPEWRGEEVDLRTVAVVGARDQDTRGRLVVPGGRGRPTFP